MIAIELAAGALPLHEAPLDGDVCLAIGNEDHGCSAAVLAAADAVAMAVARRRSWAPGS